MEEEEARVLVSRAGAAAGFEDLTEGGPELVVLEGVDPGVEAAVEDGQQREVVPQPGADPHAAHHLGQQAGQVGRPQRQEHTDHQSQRLGVLGVAQQAAGAHVLVQRALHGGDGQRVVARHRVDPEVAHRDGRARRPEDGAQEQQVGAVPDDLEGASVLDLWRGRGSLSFIDDSGEPAERQRRPHDGGGVEPDEGDHQGDLAPRHDGHVLERADQRRVAVVGDGGQCQHGHAACRHQDAVRR